MTTSFERRRLEFGDRLRHLREATGLSSQGWAERLGWPRSKVSKTENGRQIATDSDIAEWCSAAGVPESVRAELVSEALDLRVEYRTWRKELQVGYQQRQRRSGEDERAASVIRAVDFGVVPGLLQIPPYARRVLSLHAEVQGLDRDIESAVAERMSRQSVLYETGKRIEILVAEAALRYPVVDPDTMRAQLDRLVGVIGLSAVRFGILPLDRPMPYFPMHGFWIVGDEVLVENMTAEIRVTDETEVRIFNDIADRLWTVAAEGDEARGLLGRVAADLG